MIRNVLMEKFGVGISSGADTVPFSMRKELTKNNLDVYLTEGLNLWTDEAPDGNGYHFSKYNPEKEFDNTYFDYKDLYRNICSNYYDIIHSHTRSKNLIKLNKNLKKIYNTPLVHTIHGMDSLYDEIDIEMMKMSDLVTSPSAYACEMIKYTHPWVEDKILPVPNFTDYTKYTYDKNIKEKAEKLKTETCQNGEKLILATGRLQEDKGIYEIADACLNLLDSGENVKLVYVGPDFYEEGAKEKIFLKFLDRGYQNKIMVRGKVPEEEEDELKAWYKAADIFVLPSDTQHETFGLTPLEALSMETPVIVSDVGGLKEIYVDSGLGIGVKPRNAKSIEKGIRYTLQNYEYEKKRAKTARSIVDKWYSPEIISNIWSRIYDRLNNEIVLNPSPNLDEYKPYWAEEIENFIS